MATAEFDSDTIRIAFGTRDAIVQVWSLGNTAEKINPIYSIQIHETIPICLRFVNRSRELLAFGMWDECMCVAKH